MSQYTFRTVEAEMKVHGEHCMIWWDTSIALDSEKIADIQEAFEVNTPLGEGKGIYQLLTETLGARVPDVDENGTIYILVTELPEDVYGYFFRYDQMPGDGNPYMVGKIEMWSNHADIVYLSHTLTTGEPDYSMEGVLAHEFQHLLHYMADPYETTWLNEGLSQYAMYLCGYGHGVHDLLEKQIQEYCQMPEVPLTEWRTSWASRQAGGLYLWFLYLHDRFDEATGSWTTDHQLASRVFRSPSKGMLSIRRVLGDDGALLGKIFSEWGLANLLIGNTDAPAFPAELQGIMYQSLPWGVYQLQPSRLHELAADEELGPRNRWSNYYTNHYIALKRTQGGEIGVGFDGMDEASLRGKYRLHFARQNESTGQYHTPRHKELSAGTHTTVSAGPDPYVANLGSAENLVMVVSVDSKGAYDLGYGSYIYWTGNRPLIVTYPYPGTVINKSGQIRWTPAQDSLIFDPGNPENTELQPDVYFRLEHSDEVEALYRQQGMKPRTYLVQESTRGIHLGGPWHEMRLQWDSEPGVEIHKLSSYPAPSLMRAFWEDFEDKPDWSDGDWLESHPLLSNVVSVGGNRKGRLVGDDVEGHVVTVQHHIPTLGLLEGSLSFEAEAVLIEGSTTEDFWAVSLSYDNGATWHELDSFGEKAAGFQYDEKLPSQAMNNPTLWIKFSIFVPGGAEKPRVQLLLDNIEVAAPYSLYGTMWGEPHFIRAHEVDVDGLPVDRKGNPLPGGQFQDNRWSYSNIYTVFHYSTSAGYVEIVWASHEDFDHSKQDPPGSVEIVPSTPPVNFDDGRMRLAASHAEGILEGHHLRVDGIPEGISLSWRVDEATYDPAAAFAEFQIQYTEVYEPGVGPDWSQGSGWAGPDNFLPGPGNEAATWWSLPNGTAGDLGAGERVVGLGAVIDINDVFFFQWRIRLHGAIEVKDVSLALSDFTGFGYDVIFMQFDPSNGVCLLDETFSISCMVMLDISTLDAKDVFAGIGLLTGSGDMGFRIQGMEVPCIDHSLHLVSGDHRFQFIRQDLFGYNPQHPYMGMMVANLSLADLPNGGYLIQPFVTTVALQRKECDEPWYFYVDREAPRCDFKDAASDFFVVPVDPNHAMIREIPLTDDRDVWPYPCVIGDEFILDDDDERQFYAFNIYHVPDYQATGYAEDTKWIPDETSVCRPGKPYETPDTVGIQYIEVALERIGLDIMEQKWFDVEDATAIGHPSLSGEGYQNFLWDWSMVLDFETMGPEDANERQGFYFLYSRSTDQCGNQTPETATTPTGTPLGDPWGRIRLLYDIELPLGEARFNAAPNEEPPHPCKPCMGAIHVSALAENTIRNSKDLQIELVYADNVSECLVPDIGVKVLYDAKIRDTFHFVWENAPILPDLDIHYPKDPLNQWITLREPDSDCECAVYIKEDFDSPAGVLYHPDLEILFDDTVPGATVDMFIWYKDEAGNVSSADGLPHASEPIDRHLTTPDPVPYVATVHLDNTPPGVHIQNYGSECQGCICVEPYQRVPAEVDYWDQVESWGTPSYEMCINVRVTESSSEPDWPISGWFCPGTSRLSLSSIIEVFDASDLDKIFYIWVKVMDKAGNTAVAMRCVVVSEDCVDCGKDANTGWVPTGARSKPGNRPGRPQRGDSRLLYWRMD